MSTHEHEGELCAAAVFDSPGTPLRLVKVPVQCLKPGEVLVRNEYTTLCRSDLSTFTGKRTERTPTILGHEIVGRIVTLGPGSPEEDLRGKPLSVGDRITWAIYASDPQSELSRRGFPQKGEGLVKYGHERVTPDHTLHGGLSEYCILRAHTPIVHIDESIHLPVAATVNCALATVAGALRLSGSLADRRVAVCGVGMLGIYACAMSKMAGARKIIAIDTEAGRLETARQFGADATVLAKTSDTTASGPPYASAGCEVDVVLELSGSPQAMETTLDWLGIGGTAVWVGATFPQRQVRVNAEQIVRRLVTVRGLHNYNDRDLLTAVGFIEAHHQAFPFDQLIHEQFGLSEVNEAFAHALESNAYRVGVRIAK